MRREVVGYTANQVEVERTKGDEVICTVIDLRVLFNGKHKTLPIPTVAVMLVYQESKICAVVDGVSSILGINIAHKI